MDDETLRRTLRDAPVPEPVGGLDAARDRALRRLRTQPPRNVSLWWRYRHPLSATVLCACAAATAFFLWPTPPTADLPSDRQIQQFYDQHELGQSDLVAEQTEG